VATDVLFLDDIHPGTTIACLRSMVRERLEVADAGATILLRASCFESKDAPRFSEAEDQFPDGCATLDDVGFVSGAVMFAACLPSAVPDSASITRQKSEPIVATEWSCPQCTLNNEIMSPSCGVCGFSVTPEFLVVSFGPAIVPFFPSVFTPVVMSQMGLVPAPAVAKPKGNVTLPQPLWYWLWHALRDWSSSKSVGSGDPDAALSFQWLAHDISESPAQLRTRLLAVVPSTFPLLDWMNAASVAVNDLTVPPGRDCVMPSADSILSTLDTQPCAEVDSVVWKLTVPSYVRGFAAQLMESTSFLQELLSRPKAGSEKLVMSALTVCALDTIRGLSDSSSFWRLTREIWKSVVAFPSTALMIGSAVLVNFVLTSAGEAAIPSRLLPLSRELLAWLQSLSSHDTLVCLAKRTLAVALSELLVKLASDATSSLAPFQIPHRLFYGGYAPDTSCVPADCRELVQSLLLASSFDGHALLSHATARVPEPALQRKRGSAETAQLSIHAFVAYLHCRNKLSLLESACGDVAEDVTAALKFAYSVKRDAMDYVKERKDASEIDSNAVYRAAKARAAMLLHAPADVDGMLSTRDLKQFIVNGPSPVELMEALAIRAAGVRVLSDVIACLSLIGRLDRETPLFRIASLRGHQYVSLPHVCFFCDSEG
jgi:hypothetical protein